MVRFLRSTCDDFETDDDLESFLFIEKVVSILYILSSICFAVGALAGGGVMPYAARYEWHLTLISSAFFVIMNARDANYCVEAFFSARSTNGKLAATCANGKLRGSIEGQMHMFSAVSMTMGSLSLLNASVIALVQKGESNSCRKQYVMAFLLHLVGAAANNVITDAGLRHAHGTRLLLNFQHIVGSAAMLISGVLMLSEMGFPHDNLFHKGVLIMSTTLGSVISVLASVMHYFHSVSFSWMQRDFYETRGYELSGLETELGKNGQDEELDNRGYLRRLRDLMRVRRKMFTWSEAPRDTESGQVAGEMPNTVSEAELLIGESFDDDIDAASVTSARSSELVTDSSEGEEEQQQDRWRRNRVVRFGT